MSEREVSLAVVGLGYWGPNLARNVSGATGARLSWLCERDADLLGAAASLFPGVACSGSLDEVLEDPGLDGVLLATPVSTHAQLAQRVLAAGKHCFVEKPMATSTADAQTLIDAAAAAERVLMVGHLLEYHPGVAALAALIEDGELGEIHYIYSNRLNLGQLRADENALWSLGAHDVAVILAFAGGEEPVELQARGECYMRPGVEDVVFAFMRFQSGLAAHLHLSWLDPHKERRITVVGSRRMATFDDMEIERKLTVYDKGFDERTDSWGEYIARSGASTSPRIPPTEPLALEVEHFVQCIRSGERPRTDGASGLRVVRVLEGLQAQLEASRR